MSRCLNVILVAFLSKSCICQVFVRFEISDPTCTRELSGEANDLSSRGANGANVRLIDANGASSNAGLLQVRTGNADAVEFGTVCGMNSVCVFSLFSFLLWLSVWR